MLHSWKEYGVGVSTICDLRRIEDKATLQMEKEKNSAKKRKVVRKANDEALDKDGQLCNKMKNVATLALTSIPVSLCSVPVVYKRGQMPVTGPQLCEKAKQLHRNLQQSHSCIYFIFN